MKEIGKKMFLICFIFIFFLLELSLFSPRALSWMLDADRELQDSRRVYEKGNELGLGVRDSFPEEVSYITSTEI